MTKLKHYDNLGTARFITFSCYHRYQLLTDKQVKNIFLQNLSGICESYNIKILGYVLMPEHVHLVLYPEEQVKLGIVIGRVKSISARKILDLFRERNSDLLRLLTVGETHLFWQKRCYDHNCRTEGTVIEKINYCHKNPVTRRLVTSPEDWLFSSYRWYHGMDKIMLDIDGIKL